MPDSDTEKRGYNKSKIHIPIGTELTFQEEKYDNLSHKWIQISNSSKRASMRIYHSKPAGGPCVRGPFEINELPGIFFNDSDGKVQFFDSGEAKVAVEFKFENNQDNQCDYSQNWVVVTYDWTDIPNFSGGELKNMIEDALALYTIGEISEDVIERLKSNISGSDEVDENQLEISEFSE